MKWLAALVLASPLAISVGSCKQAGPPVDAQAGAASSAVTAPALPPVVGQEMTIVAIGDSLFAGYGLEPGQSYPARLEAALRARGINARIVNAGVSGDTTAGGLQRLDFTLNSQAHAPVLAIISLGGNDMLRGLPPEQTRSNLDAILTKLEQRKVPALLLGMLAAPNLGGEYSRKFNAIYPALAKQHQTALVPFFLQPVVGRPDLIQADHIHPTLGGIDLLVASTVDQVAGQLPPAPKSNRSAAPARH